MIFGIEEVLLVYGLAAALVVAPITAIFGEVLFSLISLGSGVFATVLSYALPYF